MRKKERRETSNALKLVSDLIEEHYDFFSDSNKAPFVSVAYIHLLIIEIQDKLQLLPIKHPDPSIAASIVLLIGMVEKLLKLSRDNIEKPLEEKSANFIMLPLSEMEDG